MHANKRAVSMGSQREKKNNIVPHINTHAHKCTHIHAARERLIVERRIVMRQSFVTI